ncbi:MAG: sensor histidine kinase [Dehalococcoidia bacterium]
MPRVRKLGWPFALVVAAWLLGVASFAVSVAFDQKFQAAGRADLSELRSLSTLAFVIPVMSALLVGSAIAIRRPRHPVGWLFAGLALMIVVTGHFDSYAAYGGVARQESLPGIGIAGVIGDASFIPLIATLGFIILLTPHGTLSGRAAWASALVAGTSALVAFGAALFRPYRGPLAHTGQITNPLELDGAAGEVAATVGVSAIAALHLALLVAVVLLFVRFFRSAGDERRQLSWLALALIPFPVLVAGAWVAAASGRETILAFVGASFMAVIPMAAGLSIERYQLYEVDRLLSRGLTYSLLSLLLVATYSVTVVFVSTSLGQFGGDAQLQAVVATLATVSLAFPARRFLQDGLDRRFNRRRFDAIATVRAFVREPAPGTTVEDVLRTALGAPDARVAFWVEDRAEWAAEDGTIHTPGADDLVAHRRGRPVASIELAGAKSDPRLVTGVVAEALPELESARLRAAIALQLVEVRESRARIVAAQAAERHRIERNLHDGAQQRLLALALNLRAAQVSPDPTRQPAAIEAAIGEVQAAVRDLRDLANGLRPAVLNDAGLAAAFEDLATRAPVPIAIAATAERFGPEVEDAAWFIGCEAIANAVKHAAPRSIALSLTRAGDHLDLLIEDDGRGGADPAGSGVRGMADRAAAAGGRVVVAPRPRGGTLVRAEIPCGS